MIRKKGSILIFTLWVLVILAILSIALSRGASSDIRLARYEADNIKAAYLTKAGVMKMLAELVKDENAYRGESKELILRNDRVVYGAFDETGRLNLNSASLQKEYLTRLGIESFVAENILEYKKIHNKDFEFMEELFLVKDMTPEAYSLIKNLATVYAAANSRLNINTASQEVLYAMIGDWGVADDILEKRKGEDGEEGTEDDGIKNISEIQGLDDPTLFSLTSDVFRIWAKAFLSGNEEPLKTAKAVVDKKSGKIYYWKEY